MALLVMGRKQTEGEMGRGDACWNGTETEGRAKRNGGKCQVKQNDFNRDEERERKRATKGEMEKKKRREGNGREMGRLSGWIGEEWRAASH